MTPETITAAATDDTAFDRERIAKLKERAHKAHGDDASYRTARLQYHSALQAAFERGTLVFVAQPKPDDDLADRLRVILPNVTPDWMLDGRTVYSLRRGENSWQAQFTQDGRHLTPWAEVEANAQLSQLAPQTATAYLAALDQIAALTTENASLRAQLDRIDAAISGQLERSAAAYEAGMAEGLARYAKGPIE